MGSNARWKILNVNGSQMDVFMDIPKGTGPFPAVIVAHHRAGNDVATTKFVQDLAGNGYVAASPNLHHRRPKGEDTRVSLKNLDDVEIVNDLKIVVSMLTASDSVLEKRLAIVGHCMGGRVSFLGASEIEAIACNVVYYSGNMFKIWGKGDKTPFEKIAKLRGPTLGFFGDDDENPSIKDVARIDKKLFEEGIPHEFHTYEGCGHAFQNFSSPDNYRAKATADSFKKMIVWLGQNL